MVRFWKISILPKIFDKVRGKSNVSIVVVVSPLIALMKDQVSAFNSMGITSTLISDAEHAIKSVRTGIKQGEYQVIFVSPEALFCKIEWRRMLESDLYRQNLVGFIVDEAHCIERW